MRLRLYNKNMKSRRHFTLCLTSGRGVVGDVAIAGDVLTWIVDGCHSIVTTFPAWLTHRASLSTPTSKKVRIFRRSRRQNVDWVG